MKLRNGSKVKFVEGTKATKRGREIPIDYEKEYKVISVNWGRVAVMIENLGAVYVYTYQLKGANSNR